MRKAKHWDQKKLAEVALGKAELQSMISRYENPDYGKYSMQTLLDLAKAFDVALEVKFAPFSSIVRLDEELPKSILAVPSFTQELEKGVLVSERQSDTSGSFTSVPATESFYRPAQAIKASVVTDNLVYATTFANFLIKPIDAPKVSYACQ
jgi:transcriptional regulator with XRE-family HTH domain